MLFNTLNHITRNTKSYLSIKKLSSTINFKGIPEHKGLFIERVGNPLECVELRLNKPEHLFPKQLQKNQVFVKHLAAPINPADINVIQGVYGVKPTLPTFLGNEGTGVVLGVGPEVNNIKEGDKVIFCTAFSKSWQTHSVVDDDTLQVVPQELKLVDAAQLKVNPTTAHLLLKEYVKLKPGEAFVQNGANSACGVFVIQLAKAWGLKSINVIRDRPDKEELIDELKSFGADIVITESELSKIETVRSISDHFGKVKLVLNCVGGKNVSDCSKLLANDGCVVTYGAMSKKRVELSAAHIFKNITYYPHWTSLHLEKMRKTDRPRLNNLFNTLSQMFIDGLLKSKATTQIQLNEYKQAFESIEKSSKTKHIFIMDQ